MNAAMCDYDAIVDGRAGNKYGPRFHTKEGGKTINIIPSPKTVAMVRRTRKDLFLVAFKTTCGASEDEQYIAGLNLLKENHCNLVLANDTKTLINMIIVPEEARYCVVQDREQVLNMLVAMVKARSGLTYTRSNVVPGESFKWASEDVPANLRKVVDHCIAAGAYKPFRGATAGHFAFKQADGWTILEWLRLFQQGRIVL
jgi:hypothetical protein